ncbi:hypothetical protein E2C01_012844 [Portunus trituberculatus]|uniref:Uncharacterized protein n=1 Tax=Portunus trituberculatus TaxID=210409 RepID=A0A5B7DF63_PORTR|nr:hypothetical protein [Portunus trituberculatus]
MVVAVVVVGCAMLSINDKRNCNFDSLEIQRNTLCTGELRTIIGLQLLEVICSQSNRWFTSGFESIFALLCCTLNPGARVLEECRPG